MLDKLANDKDQITKLQDKYLLLNTVCEIQKEDVVGEEVTILVLINKSSMRNVKNCKPTSSNSILSDISGVGKDYIPKKTFKVTLQKHRYIHRTDISDRAFDYWQPLKPMDEWDKDANGKPIKTYDSWDRYVLHLEDPREDAINGQSFKTMASGGTEVSKVIDNRAKHIQIDGKPVMIITSLKTVVNIEGIRRFDTIRLDTSSEQTEQIINYKLKSASGIIKYEPDNNLRQGLQTKLFPKYVVIPYADQLRELFPNSIQMRTLIDTALDCIKASAVFHQHQRKKIDNDTIIADGFDFGYGWFVFTILNSGISIPTNPDEEELVRILIDKGSLTINQLSNLYTRHSKKWIYENRENLVNKGLIRTFYEHSIEANKEVEHLTAGDNAYLVLTGFHEVFTIAKKIGFNGFNGFYEIIQKIKENRKKIGLNDGFCSWISENGKNRENPPRNGSLKPPENIVKASLDNRVTELREYFKSREEQNKKITYEQLCFDFDKFFIEKCKEQKLIMSKPDGGYVWGRFS